jgi:hypothetical protein
MKGTRRMELKTHTKSTNTNTKNQKKRKLADAFGAQMHDNERYGQEIPSDYFTKGIGHNVYFSFTISEK